MRLQTFVTAVVVSMATPAPTSAQDTSDTTRSDLGPDSIPVYVLDSLTVRGRIDDLSGTAISASVGYVGFRDLRLRPLSREGELLETVPGMILTQHSGSGKSNQMFVRGFNLDHGTDFSTRVEGMPINIPSHAHGQGYTDLNFLIPELVDHVEYSLGAYYAEIGDFSSAGGAHLRLRRSLEEPLFVAGLGEHAFERVVVATPAQIGDRGSLLVGGEYKGYNGPWERPEELRKLSGVLRYTWQGPSTSLSLLALGYDNGWNASDQIPLRSIQSATIDRYGQIDPTLGGATSRYSLSGTWSRSSGGSSQRVDVYGVRYDLDLFSNFTYLLEDPTAGDQIRQRDKGRWTVGIDAEHVQPLPLGGGRHSLKVGAQARSDRASVSLARTSRRESVSFVRRDDVAQWSAGAYWQLESSWQSWLRTTVGLRSDVHSFDVSSDRPENSGSTEDAILSPKFSIAFLPRPGTELYGSAGFGFHSNDARGTVQRVDPATGDPVLPVVPLVRSLAAEVGVRATPRDDLRSTLAVWTVGLDSELLFVGDAGATEPVGPSRRLGVTFANFYRIGSGWTADLDLSFTRARFLDASPGEDRIPGALENVVAGGVSYEPLDDGVFGAVRLRRFGTYPLIEDDAQRANANQLLNINLGARIGRARLTVSVLNVLDEEHSDIQYYYRSRLQGEPPSGVEDLHLHPAEPRQVRVALSWGT